MDAGLLNRDPAHGGLRGPVEASTGHRTQALDELVAAYPGQIESLALDVTDMDATRVIDDVVTRHDRIDVLGWSHDDPHRAAAAIRFAAQRLSGAGGEPLRRPRSGQRVERVVQTDTGRCRSQRGRDIHSG